MEVVQEIDQVREFVRSARERGCRIGCVPTMGALHAGHMSLVDECRERVDETVVTIFVNPTQFGPGEDLEKYPRPLEDDLAKCRKAGVGCVYVPEIPTLYPDGYDTWVEVENLSTVLEGEHRPGHFRGVTTIVCKLLNILQPDVACFGAKDYQQQTLIRRMVIDLNIPTEIVVCPTLRDTDGLALSSRNVYLSASEREVALSISRALQSLKEQVETGSRDWETLESEMVKRLEDSGVELQYAVIRDTDTLQPVPKNGQRIVALIAGFVGKTRLIDNLEMELP